MILGRILVPAAILMAGCGTGSDEDALVSVALAGTPLAGSYVLADYLLEYEDGNRLDPSVLPVTGTLTIRPDSSYLEDIRIGGTSTPTKGRIARILASGDGAAGELELTLEDGDASTAGKSAFSFRKDTLVLITEVSKERDVSKTGFRETAYYARDSRAGEPSRFTAPLPRNPDARCSIPERRRGCDGSRTIRPGRPSPGTSLPRSSRPAPRLPGSPP